MGEYFRNPAQMGTLTKKEYSDHREEYEEIFWQQKEKIRSQLEGGDLLLRESPDKRE